MAAFGCATCALAQPAAVMSSNTPGFVRSSTDLGPVDATSTIVVNVWLKLHNQQKLDKLVEQQKQRGSSNYRRWITQSQFNSDYGPTNQEVNAVSNFLSAHNLTVMSVAENNLYVKAQGTVDAMQKAFHVQIHKFNHKGQTFRSNTGDPSVTDSNGGLIAAVTGLDDFGFQPKLSWPGISEGAPPPSAPLASGPNGVFFESQCFRPVETDAFTSTTAAAAYTGNRYGANISNTALGHLPPCGYQPSELQRAYNLGPLYSAGLAGQGETIVITDAFGSPTIAQDAAAFSSVYGLPPVDLTIAKGSGLSHNPADVSGGWDTETTLDVEWAHALAPSAKIVLVLATDRASLDEAINYAVVHHLGNTISNSWATLEGFGNPAQFDRVNRILEMAAAQGIDTNFASGDDGDELLTAGFQTVDFPASSPFATGIGGTSLAMNADHTIAFQSGWGNNLTMIAETTALQNAPVVPPQNLGFQGGSGGGASLTFARPAFQSGLSIPGGTRLVPDISMVADPFTGVEVIQTINGQLTVAVIGGTSLSTPLFSAVMAIAAQKAGHGLGQAAPLLYGLPAGALTDVVPVSSPGNVTGVVNGAPQTANSLAAPLGNTTTYFSSIYNSPFSTRWFVITFGTDSSLVTSPGWDNATGLGTLDAFNFVSAIQ